MWGFFRARDRNLAHKIFDLIRNPQIAASYNGNLRSPKGADQSFLAHHVHPLIKDKSIIHDSFLCTSYGGGPFPTKRVGTCFIGSTGDCNVTGNF